MKVTLIDYTGAGSESPASYAARLLVYTKNTRLEQGDTTRLLLDQMSAFDIVGELNYIAKTIRSSWEFIDYTFEVTGVTRAYTHQQVRTRTASYAQQSQRSVDMEGFDTLIPKTVSENGMYPVWKDLMEKINQTYQLLTRNGIPVQDARGVLPTNILTNIIVKVNLRTLADLVGKRENLRAQGEYADVVRAMKEAALHVHPWIGPFLNPERKKTPALDAILARVLGEATPFSRPQVNDALKELDSLKETWG